MGKWVLRTYNPKENMVWEKEMFKCNAFPLLDTYMKALTHENNVKPIRGTNQKPIHLRSRKYMQIAVLPNEDVVYFDGWGTGQPKNEWDYIVKWKPNGEIHIQAPMYNCVYEQLTSLLGIRFFRQANALWVQTHTTLKLRPAFGQDPSVFKWKDDRLVYTNPPEVTQKAINRSVAKAVRAKYKRIYDYLKSMVKLRDDNVYPLTEFADVFDFDLADAQKQYGAYWAILRMTPKITLDVPLSQQDDIVEMISLANEGDLDMSRKLWLACAYANGFRLGWSNDGDVHCAPNQVVKAFDNFILRLHREEVFYDKVVPRGKTPSTANNKFFD